MLYSVQPYANALFEIAKDTNRIEKIKSNIDLSKQFLDSKYISLLSNSFIDKEERIECLGKVLEQETFEKDYVSFLKVLIMHEIIFHIDEIFNTFDALCNDYFNIEVGKVYSTEPLNSLVIQKIENAMSKKINKKVCLNNEIDLKLISGIKVVVKDMVIEYSLASKIANLKKEL